MKETILLAGHYTPTPGPMDKLAAYFYRKNYDIVYFHYPLYPRSGAPVWIGYKKKRIEFHLPALVQFAVEGVAALIYYKKNVIVKKFRLGICGDPLSFFHHYLLRRFYRIDKLIYFNVDFSTQRYRNPFLNAIYQWVNRFAFTRSDYFFALTPKFTEFLDPYKKYAKKSFVISHWIHRGTINRTTIRKPNSLIYAGSITTGLNFEPLLQSLVKMKKNNQVFTFDIYGSGGETDNLRKLIKTYQLEHLVTLKGIVPNEKLTQEVFPRYMIGVCPYILKNTVVHADHMFQGVSLTTKLVEYIAAGLPIITTPLTRAFDEIEKKQFGMVVQTKDEWYHALSSLFTEQQTYINMQQNAFEFAKQFDEETVLTPVFTQVLP